MVGRHLRARRAEKKFVIVSLQSWWCPWCHAMNRDTWANPDVRAVLKDHFIPVACRPGQPPRHLAALRALGLARHHHLRPRRHGDREAARLLFAEILHPDPAGDDPRSLAGRLRQARRPERERTLATGLSDAQRAEILAFIDKAYDRANGGWSKSKLVDGPTLGWFLDRAKAGDKEAEARIRRSLTAQIALIDKESGGISQVSLKPDWSQPSLEFPMFAQQAALSAYARAGRAVRRSGLSRGRRPHLRLPQEHARRTGRRLLCLDGHGRGPARRRQAPVCARDRPGDPGPRSPTTTRPATRGAGARRRAPPTGRCASAPAGRRLPPCRARRGRALSRRQCRDGRGPAGAASLDRRAQMAGRRATPTGDFIAGTFIDPKTGGFFASASPDARHLPKPIKQREDNVTATRFFTLLAAYSGDARYREIAEAGMGYLASPPVLDAYAFLPDVLLAEEELQQRAGACDRRRRRRTIRAAPRSMPPRSPIRCRQARRMVGQARGQARQPRRRLSGLSPTARRPSPARATSARCR